MEKPISIDSFIIDPNDPDHDLRQRIREMPMRCTKDEFIELHIRRFSIGELAEMLYNANCEIDSLH